MSKIKSVVAILSLLTTTATLTACDPVAAIVNDFGQATDICADIGSGQCPRGNPDDFTTK